MAEDPMRAKARAMFGKSFMDAVKPKQAAKSASNAPRTGSQKPAMKSYNQGGATKKPKRKEPEISTYRPGFVEGLTDATLGAALRQLERARGASERDAYRRAGDAMRTLEDVTGWQQGERSVKNIVRGEGTGEDYLNVGLAALPGAGGVIGKKIASRALRGAATPSVRNRLYEDAIIPKREYTQVSPDLPKYGYRNVSSPAELDDIARSGYMLPPKGKRNADQKYFTMSNDEVPKAGNRGSKPILRVESRHIPEGSPVRRQHVRQWDEETGTWRPIRRKSEGGEVASQVDQNSGIGKRSKVRRKGM